MIELVIFQTPIIFVFVLPFHLDFVQVFAAITASYATCPSIMCRLFDALRQCAARHFPRNAEVRYSVVSGFIFLRFFAPAILGPRLFDLTTEQIVSTKNNISKTIYDNWRENILK